MPPVVRVCCIPKASSPRSWDVVTTKVLGTVKLLVLHSRIPGPHQVVEEHACCDNELDGLGLLLYRAQENLEPIGKDGEGIFYDPPGSGKRIFQNALWPLHTPEAVQYNTIQYNTIQYNTIQYNTIQYNTIQYNTIQYNTIQINLLATM